MVKYNSKDILNIKDSLIFSDLYDNNVKMIYDFLYYKTFDKDVAEDLTQETFVKAIDKSASFK